MTITHRVGSYFTAVTDTLKLPHGTPDGLIDVISVAPLVGDAMKHVFEERSVSAMFGA